MPTYPLTFPSIGITSSRFRLSRATSKSTSPFTGEEQVYRWSGEWWSGEVSFIPMRMNEANAVKAFLAEMRGQYGTFLYGDPDNLALGNQGAGGTVTVNGADQTGNTLTVDGMTVSTTGILKAGDYFQLGTGTSARLYMVTQDLDSDGSGEGTITFEPALRTSPADNDTVVVSSPKGAFRLAENIAEWRSDKSSIHEMTISFREAL